MIDLIQHLRDKGRRLVVMPPDATGVRVVYAITHIHTPELAGMAPLETGRAQRKYEEHQHLLQRLKGCKTEKERARVTAEVQAAADQVQKALEEDLWSTPERQAAYIERCRATVCASVQAVGRAREDAPPGPQPFGTHARDVCIPLAEPDGQEPIYLTPLRVVPERTLNPEPGTVCAFDYDDDEVMALQLLFAAAFSVQALVTPLPVSAGSAGVGASDGGDLRPETERVPARSRQARGSAGHPVRAGRKGG